MNVGRIDTFDQSVPLPQKPWWFLTGIFAPPGRPEERFVLVKLPSWSFEFSVNRDAPVWMQRMLIYCGRSGFSLGWVP